MAEEKSAKRIKTFRIDSDLSPKVQKIAKKLDRPESWVINQCLKLSLPNLEKQAAKAV